MNQALKVFGSNTLVAIIFLLVVAGAGTVGSMVVGEGLRGNLNDIGTAYRQANALMLVWVLISIFILGAVILALYKLSKYIKTKVFHIEGSAATTPGIPKRVKIGGLFVVGLAGSVLIFAFNSFVNSINPDIDITSLSALQYAVNSANAWVMIAILFAVAIIGYIISYVGKQAADIQSTVDRAVSSLKK